MELEGITRRMMSDEIGVSEQMISAFFLGKSVSMPIAEWLRRRGCPRGCFKGTRYEGVRRAA
jgi:hypothetical protein